MGFIRQQEERDVVVLVPGSVLRVDDDATDADVLVGDRLGGILEVPLAQPDDEIPRNLAEGRMDGLYSQYTE